MTVAYATHRFHPPEYVHDPQSLSPTPFRISVIARSAGTLLRDWRASSSTQATIIVDAAGDSMRLLVAAVSNPELDVARVVLDGGTPQQFLDLLTSAPAGSLCDILWISDDDSGYMSSIGRGGDRVLYSLRATDVRFYLEVHDLVSGRELLAATRS